MAASRKSSPSPAPAPSALPPLSLAVKRVRQKYGDSQEAFAQRLALSNMTVSKFERGVNIPRDALVLERLSAAAKAVELTTEADQFTAAYTEAIGVEMVNRIYPGRGRREEGLTMRFETLREWKGMAAALFSERYKCDIGPVRAIVDHVVRGADTSRGIGPGWYQELEAQVKVLMEEREQKRTTTT
jgi:transcriptional regulator with XRE-family HTH domain